MKQHMHEKNFVPRNQVARNFIAVVPVHYWGDGVFTFG